ncbi:MAG: DUF423 domain-containing protein [Anaerolineales bacterium]|nr:DUF423 domain-containing protein [Anaerolineales bacterium]
MKLFVLLSSVLMFIGVGAGAFGAHALADLLTQSGREGTYETAVRYQMYHALALLAVAWLTTQIPSNLVNWAGWLFFIGVLIFSGSLYLLVFTGRGWFGAITPIGGVAFLAGWVCLFVAVLRS